MEPRGLISSIPGYNFLSRYLVLILKMSRVFLLYFMLISGVILSAVLLISSESSLHILRKM